MDEKLPKARYFVDFNHLFLKENDLACVSEACLRLSEIKTSSSRLSDTGTCCGYSDATGNGGAQVGAQVEPRRGREIASDSAANTPTHSHHPRKDPPSRTHPQSNTFSYDEDPFPKCAIYQRLSFMWISGVRESEQRETNRETNALPPPHTDTGYRKPSK